MSRGRTKKFPPPNNNNSEYYLTCRLSPQVKIEIIALCWQDFGEEFTALLYLFVIPPGTCIPKQISKNSPTEIIPFLSVLSRGFFIFCVQYNVHSAKQPLHTLTLTNPFAQESKVKATKKFFEKGTAFTKHFVSSAQLHPRELHRGCSEQEVIGEFHPAAGYESREEEGRGGNGGGGKRAPDR